MDGTHESNGGAHPPSDKEKAMDLAVLSYLRKRGYKQAEASFKQDSNLQSIPIDQLSTNALLDQELSVAHYIMFHNPSDSLPQSYNDSYVKLCNWIHASLDLYKQEFLVILYPIFVHCYLDLVAKGHVDEAQKFMEVHGKDHMEFNEEEIKRLRGIATPPHLAENELAQTFRNHKFNVHMCTYSFELLISFLQEAKLMLLISIINQYLSIRVSPFRPGAQQANAAVTGVQQANVAITGSSEKQIADLHTTPIWWGLFDSEKDKKIEEIEEKGGPEVTKPKKDSKKKKEKEVPDARKETQNKPKSAVPLPKMSEQYENEIQDDVSKRVPLNATFLPSICFSTLFHTHHSLNTVDISRDASMIAAGFADSSVRLWDLKKFSKKPENSENSPPTPTLQNSTNSLSASQSLASSSSSIGKRKREEYRLLLGHSGPVFGSSFSSDNQFLLTCSEDTTVRLWSMDTASNVVVYKSHNYPVWDVSFSPVLGYYFATASHDRTARVWATPHIQPLRILAGHLADVTCVRFHPNINYVATGSSDKSLRLWEIHTGKCMRIFTGHHGGINTLAFSPDGRLLASAGDDRVIMLWDLATSKCVSTMNGHTGPVYSLDFSCEGSILASGAHDGTVRLWDPLLGQPKNSPDMMSVDSEPNGHETESPIPPSNTINPTLDTTTQTTGDPLLKTFHTKHTPVYSVMFTRRNLLMAAGPFLL